MSRRGDVLFEILPKMSILLYACLFLYQPLSRLGEYTFRTFNENEDSSPEWVEDGLEKVTDIVVADDD